MRSRALFFWVALAILAAVVLGVAFPRAFPLLPGDWQLNRDEARGTALALLEDLAPVPGDGSVTARLVVDRVLEGRLMREASELRALCGSGNRLVSGVLAWEITVYPRKALSTQWSHRALLAPGGEILELRLNPEIVAAGPGIPSQGSPQATAGIFLQGLGFDRDAFSVPTLRTRDLPGGIDGVLRYTSVSEAPVFGEVSGVDILFRGPKLVGMTSWYEGAGGEDVQALLQPGALLSVVAAVAVFVFLPIAGVAFVRRYHAGEVGVGSALRVTALCLGAGGLGLAFAAGGILEPYDVPLLTRAQVTWVLASQLLVFHFLPVAVVCFLAWSVGESICQERWPHKLASVAALRRGAWRNRTVAGASLRGLALGLALNAGLFVALIGLKPLGVWSSFSHLLGWSLHAPWPGLTHVSLGLTGVLYKEPLLLLLLFVPLARRFGLWTGGLLVTVLGGVAFSTGLTAVPVLWGLALGVVSVAAVVWIFVRFDLLTALVASLLLFVTPGSLVMLFSQDPWLQFQGCLPFVAAAVPLILSARWLSSDEEFVYRYDEVPTHVRRIAQRERQSLELETARSIQSSILPALPPVLAGVEIAHAYRPATEVGGDFYDVLDLKDGRLAVAVGDVAGHGVSSGLIMSMVKSALAVQVTYDPAVPEVFTTLNRMVYQSAGKRLLATLSYLVLDPRSRGLRYSSAGHVAPYLVGLDGAVTALEAGSYPLGARPVFEVSPHQARLAAGDLLFLYSDGLVEARATGSEELFGFDRLEASLRSHVGKSAADLRDAVLEDLAAFTGDSVREDDQTVLVLRLP